MFTLIKIETETGKETLEAFLKTREFLPVFFYSPHCLMTWLTHMGKSLYIAYLDSAAGRESALIVHKERLNDIRFLYDEPSAEMLAAITERFDPQYIAVNELLLPKGTEFHFNENKVMKATDPRTGLSYIGNNELAISVDCVAQVTDIDLASDYRKFMRKHGDLQIERYDAKYFDAIQAFMKEWSEVRTEEQNKFAMTENDMRFIELFGNHEDVVGTLIIDPALQKIVAVSFFVPALDGNAVGVISKTLREYKQLGVGLAVARAKAMAEQGYEKMYIGNINNEFKKRFIPCGEKVRVYSRMVFCKPELEVGIRYLLMLF